MGLRALLFVLLPGLLLQAEPAAGSPASSAANPRYQSEALEAGGRSPESGRGLWVTPLGDRLPDRLTPAQARFVNSLLNPPRLHKGALLDESGLGELLAQIVEPQESSQVVRWWESLLEWLKSLKVESDGDDWRWLVDLIKGLSPSEDTARALVYIAGAVTVLAALALVGRELYLGGPWFRFVGRRRRMPKREAAGDRNVPADSAVDPDTLPPAGQVALLLRRCIAVMAERGELPNNPALTNHELCLCLRQNFPASAAAFASLAELAEPVLYGNEDPPRQVVLQCRHQSSLILTQ